MAEYIEREALMRRIKEIHCAECDSYHGVRCRACWVDDTLDYIDSEPTADVAPVRHAHWEYWDGWMSNHDMRIECACSACGYKDVVRGYGYDNIKHLPERCHGCWAKMDEEASE